jgi:hypothetical protein
MGVGNAALGSRLNQRSFVPGPGRSPVQGSAKVKTWIVSEMPVIHPEFRRLGPFFSRRLGIGSTAFSHQDAKVRSESD